jgi:hypothetical protein
MGIVPVIAYYVFIAYAPDVLSLVWIECLRQAVGLSREGRRGVASPVLIRE